MKIIVFCCVLSLYGAYVRMERKSAFGPLVPVLVEGDFENLTVRKAREKTQFSKVESDDSFEFRVECSSVSEDLCNWAKLGFIRAGRRIEKCLKITNQIVVHAQFHSFCAAQSGSCATVNNTLGRASAAAFFAAKSIKSETSAYYYPQALIKQLETDQKLTLAKFDIFAEFNSDFKFWFKDSELEIQHDQIDFEFVVAHELTHGLGIDSGWVSFASFYSGFTSEANYLAPLLFAKGPSPLDATVTFFSPLSIYDKFLQTESVSMASEGLSISTFSKKGQKVPEFIASFESSPQLSNAKKVMSAATSGQNQPLVFKTENGSQIVINTPKKFEPGTSLVHMPITFSNTKDFLMIPVIKPLVGQKLDDIMRKVQAEEIYGPGTISIMSTIGWPTHSKERSRIIIQKEFESMAVKLRRESHLTMCLVFLSFF